LDLAALTEGFRARGIAVTGASTAGEIANDEILDQSCAVLLLEAPRDTFEVVVMAATAAEPSFEVGRRIGAAAAARFTRPVAIAFLAGPRADGEQFIRGVHAGADRAFPLFGGVAGDDLLMTGTCVLTEAGPVKDGAAALVIDGDRVEVQGAPLLGWQTAGAARTITGAEANVVRTIDGEPALEVYRQHVGAADLTAGQTGEMMTFALGVQYPVQVQRVAGVVMRVPLFYRPDGSLLLFAGTVPQGASVSFCLPPSLDVVDRVLEEARALSGLRPHDAILLFSCKTRHLALGPLALDEIQALRGLGGVPAAGFFGYGPFGGRTADRCDLHADTCVMVTIRAKSA
jgi:hypothetical protein